MSPYDADYFVFFADGSMRPTDDEGLHDLTVREDYAYALALNGVDDCVKSLCKEYDLPWQMFASLVEDAFLQGAAAAGTAAVMTIETRGRSGAYGRDFLVRRPEK